MRHGEVHSGKIGLGRPSVKSDVGRRVENGLATEKALTFLNFSISHVWFSPG